VGTADEQSPPAAAELGARLDGIIAGWPVQASVAVIGPGATVASSGPLDVVRPWASVTKLLTALATLVAVEEGIVDLDQAAGPPGATLRHLLAHASGLGPDGDRALVAPGTRRIYSNRGFEIIGETIESASGMPWSDYVTSGVLQPLGLGATRLVGSAAAGAEGPLRDLAALGRELQTPTLVSAQTMALATSVAFPHLDGVLPGFGSQRPNDWGLGFELRSTKQPHWTGLTNSPATFGHFGQSGSFLWVDPTAGVACAELADHPFGSWAVQAWPALADAVLATVERAQTERR
jgi:CubicO group peptidase (beta-lactamase class C family)